MKQEVRALAIEARRRQQEDARWRGRHPRPQLFNFGLDPISLCSGRARFGIVRSSRSPQTSLRVLLDGGV
jgi:hypothetical protein